MLWNKRWSVGHRATQAEWSLRSSWITAAAGWRVSGWGDEDTRVKAAFDASQKMDVQEATRQASSGEPANAAINPRNSQSPEHRAPTRGRATPTSIAARRQAYD